MQGANPNIQDFEGHTPLDLALADGHESVVELLKTVNARAHKTARPRAEVYPESTIQKPKEDTDKRDSDIPPGVDRHAYQKLKESRRHIQSLEDSCATKDRVRTVLSCSSVSYRTHIGDR